MKTLKFHGYGDDTFGEYGITGQARTVIIARMRSPFSA